VGQQRNRRAVARLSARRSGQACGGRKLAWRSESSSWQSGQACGGRKLAWWSESSSWRPKSSTRSGQLLEPPVFIGGGGTTGYHPPPICRCWSSALHTGKKSLHRSPYGGRLEMLYSRWTTEADNYRSLSQTHHVHKYCIVHSPDFCSLEIWMLIWTLE
jgi:hypothetical protein